MSYHHYNRLTAHWQPRTALTNANGELKELTHAARSVAQHLAQKISSETESFYHSGTLIAQELGLNPSTAYAAIKQLLKAGYFSASLLPGNKNGLRTYRLTLECPLECQELEKHNTASALAARSKRLAIMNQPQAENPHTANEIEDTNSDTAVNASQSVSPTIMNQPQTYKDLINKDIEIDINSVEFETTFLKIIRGTLKRLGKARTQAHEWLEAELSSNPQQIDLNAFRIVANNLPNDVEAYLGTITRERPNDLLIEQGLDSPATLEAREVITENALDLIRGEDAEQLAAGYVQALAERGYIPGDLIELALTATRTMNDSTPGSLYELVARYRGESFGFDVHDYSETEDEISFTLDTLNGDLQEPDREAFGSDSKAYEAAYQHARQVNLYRRSMLNEWRANTGIPTPSLEHIEKYRQANPRLFGDPDYYHSLITEELKTLDANAPTLSEWLREQDTAITASDNLAAEFEEFWNAYPLVDDGMNEGHKGKKAVAARYWCEARKTYTHGELMYALQNDENAHLCFPALWLESATDPGSEVYEAINDQPIVINRL